MQEAEAAALGQLTLPQLALPGKIDFSNVNEWPKWIKRLKCHRVASGLNKQSQGFQENAFMSVVGDDAEDILNMLSLTEAQKKSSKDVTDAFTNHCVSNRSVIFKRARFNSRNHEPGESVESFLTAVHALAEYCEIGN